ncbi:hypothetical protein CJP72_14270 [Citrobacter sp. NCU1]|uniref:hypothetical protein n=1 Tax=Citrobacter sp. NCU1 TaxID=2026683 RepID=UPI00139204C8|nr:hypothetical protein [Citrobacter sp. NCU1]NDO81889.1 hypothetical protein [Citrobacter sp. NCU1]
MSFENAYSIFVILLSIILIAIVVTFYADYRKHSPQIVKVYELLKQQQLLRSDDYTLWEGLGFWGFGFRVTIISKLLSGKRVKLPRSRWLEPAPVKNALCGMDLEWINVYIRKNKIALIVFAALLMLSFLHDI